MSDNSTKVAEDEIDLLALAKTLWSKRTSILAITLAFMILGLIIAILSPKEFTATSTFIPQTNESSKPGGSLGGLASLAGISLGGIGGGNSDIPPSLYPKFVSSVKFKRALLEAEINVDGLDEAVTYANYYEKIAEPGTFELIKKYTIGLPFLLLESIRGEITDEIVNSKEDGLIRLTKEEVEHFGRIETQLTVLPNEKDGIVVLSFKMPEPLMAAQMAKFAEELLQKEIIEYRIQNAKEQLRFTEERFLEKKKEFDEVQSRLAYFRDRNQNLSSAAVMNQLQKLESEYSFAFNIYNELAAQLEQSKLQVAKDTPVLSVIQPVTVPTEKSAPKRLLILIIFTVLGFVLGLGYVFGNEFLKGYRREWNTV